MNPEEQGQISAPKEATVEKPQEITPTSQEDSFNWKLLSLTLIALIIGTSLVALAFYYKEQNKNRPPRNLTPEEERMVWSPTLEESFVDQAMMEDGQYVDGELPDPNEEQKPSLWDLSRLPPEIEKYKLSVEWTERPTESETYDLPINDVSRSYIVGTATNGPFQGEDVYLFYSSGMASDYPQGLFVLNPVVTEVTDWVEGVTDLPETISSTDKKINLKKEGELFAAMMDIEDMIEWNKGTIETLAFPGLTQIPENQLYTYNECLFARTPSDLVVEYIFDIPFLEDEDEGSYSTPEITYTRVDGQKITAEYEIYNRVSYGCGSLCSPLKVVDRADTDFVQTGTTEDGSKLYVLKDVNDERYKTLYTQENTRAFIDTSDGQYRPLEQNKYSFAEFISMIPLLYWKDPLDRWVEFVNTEFIILAEKCKPVIYLYPEEKTDLHVEVRPNIGFTKTIPEYGDGWNVTAYPDGTIIDRETDATYNYLYWTGFVEGYPLIEEGWVVSQEDLLAFFEYYLPQYGLQGKEISDFTEYWIEDMDEAPYYAITFVDQSIINELSPLSVEKEPDVVLRVLMTAQPLQRPIKLNPPRIPDVPERTGFTVVEWGGTILR